MNVRELIAALQKMPPDAPVVYVTDCADDGLYSVSVDCVGTKGPGHWMYTPKNLPAECVVLS